MTLPSNLLTITLTGTYLDTTGAALSGTISFTPPPELVDIANAIMYAAPVTATLDSSGHFSVTLICTDNGALAPAGWGYTVAEAIKGNRSYTIYVPHSLGSSVDISSLAPLPDLTGAPVTVPISSVAPGYGALAYNQTWTGVQTFDGEVIVPTPVNAGDPVTLAYLDAFVPTGLPFAAAAKQTANFTAAPNTIYPIDTTGGAITALLPTAPADRTLIGFKLVIQGTGDNVTYTCGGADVINKVGGGTSGTLSLVNQAALLIYSASQAIWTVISDELPLSDLDARYVLASTLPLPIANGGTGQATAPNAFNALSPLTTLGDILAAGASGVDQRVAGNTTTAKQFMTQTGTGTVSALPAWGAIAAGDLPTATTSVFGAVKLDGTSGDIQTLGAQAAGASGLVADAKHVHPFSSGVITSPVTVTGVSAATLLLGGPTLTAGTARSGLIYTFELWGALSTTVDTQTVTFSLYWGGVSGTSMVAVGPTAPNSSATVTNAAWKIKFAVTFGSSTTASATGETALNYFYSSETQGGVATISNSSSEQLVLAVTPSASAVSVTANGGYWHQKG